MESDTKTPSPKRSIRDKFYGNTLDLHQQCQQMLLRLHENHENVKRNLNDPSLRETDPYRYHSYYLVTRPKTYPTSVTKRVSPLMPINKSKQAITTTMTIDGKQLRVVKLPPAPLAVSRQSPKPPIKFNSTQSFNRYYKVNPNANNSNNVDIPLPLNPNGNRKLDVSPVFDKLGNRIGIRRYTATIQSHAKRAKVDGVNLNNSNNFVVLDSSTDLSKPISILRQAQTPIVARKTSIVGDDDEVAMELPTRRDSSGNDIVEIQPESPDEEPDDNEDENDEMGEFYMPSTSDLSLIPPVRMKSANPKAKHQCTVCDKRFVRPAELLRHTRIHTGEKPYECETCNQCFIRKDHLIRHTTRNDSLKRHFNMKHADCENIDDFTEKGHSHGGRTLTAGGEFPSGLSLLEMSEDDGEGQQLVIQEMGEYVEGGGKD